jgi:hypothetical protein
VIGTSILTHYIQVDSNKESGSGSRSELLVSRGIESISHDADLVYTQSCMRVHKLTA